VITLLFILKWLTIIADSEGVGLKMLQHTTRMSTCAAHRARRAAVPARTLHACPCTSSASHRQASRERGPGVAPNVAAAPRRARLLRQRARRLEQALHRAEHDHLRLPPPLRHARVPGRWLVQRCARAQHSGSRPRAGRLSGACNQRSPGAAGQAWLDAVPHALSPQGGTHTAPSGAHRPACTSAAPRPS